MALREKPEPGPTLEERQRREFRNALKAAEEVGEPIEPTADELRNGWTAESLAAYLAEQRAAQSLRIDPHSTMRRAAMPKRANSRYRPLKWRG